MPVYSLLCDIIGAAIEDEHRRLSRLVNRRVTGLSKKRLDGFLSQNSEYCFNTLKNEAKNLRFKEMGAELDRNKVLGEVFPVAKICIAEFSISTNNVRYLASLANHYRLSSLRSFPKDFSSVVICCYIYFRYRKSMDIVVEAFIHYIKRLEKSASEYAKQETYRQRRMVTVNTDKVADLLDIFTDNLIPNEETYSEIKSKAYRILCPKDIKIFSCYLRKEFRSVDAIKWDYYSKKHMAYKKNLRPLIKALRFYSEKSSDPLLGAVDLLTQHLLSGRRVDAKRKLPTGFIPSRLKGRVLDGSTINPDRYEMMVYLQVVRRIQARDLFVSNSSCYLSLTEDLLSDEQWKSRESFLKTTPYRMLAKSPEDILENLEDLLESKIETSK